MFYYGRTSKYNDEKLYPFIFFGNKASVRRFLLTLEPIFLSCGDRGDLDHGRAVTIIARLSSEVGTGAAMISCLLLIWGGRTRIPLRYGGRGRGCGRL